MQKTKAIAALFLIAAILATPATAGYSCHSKNVVWNSQFPNTKAADVVVACGWSHFDWNIADYTYNIFAKFKDGSKKGACGCWNNLGSTFGYTLGHLTANPQKDGVQCYTGPGMSVKDAKKQFDDISCS